MAAWLPKPLVLFWTLLWPLNFQTLAFSRSVEHSSLDPCPGHIIALITATPSSLAFRTSSITTQKSSTRLLLDVAVYNRATTESDRQMWHLYMI